MRVLAQLMVILLSAVLPALAQNKRTRPQPQKIVSLFTSRLARLEQAEGLAKVFRVEGAGHQLDSIRGQLIKIGPPYSDCLKRESEGLPVVLASLDAAIKAEEQSLREEYEKKKAEMARLQKELDLLRIEQRKEFARNYENQMLDRNLNFQVETEGDDATGLIIRWAPIDRVFIHKFDKNTKFWSKVRALGFKTVATVGSSVTGNRDLSQPAPNQVQENP